MLRRAWLLDPPLSHEELADPTTVQECFRSVCEALGTALADDPDDTKWDHERWRTHTQLPLLDPPVVVAAGDLRSVVSPWRDEIYDIYRHVFSDLWRALVAASADERAQLLGRFDPAKGDAVSVVVLPAPAEAEAEAPAGERYRKVDKTAFATDTFVYPVWVNPRAEISFAAEGTTAHSWSVEEEEATWTTGLWVQAGRDVALTTEMKDVDGGADETKIAAVFVTGHCDERERESG